MPGVVLRLFRIPPDYVRNAWCGLIKWRFDKNRPARIVQGVVIDNERVLLAVRADLWGWELPGGAPEPDEAFEVALLREIQEETGVDAEVVEFVGEYERTGFHPHVAHVYRCRPVRGNPRTSRETSQVAWFPISHLPDTLFPWFRGPLLDAVQEKTGVRRQEHQGLSAIVSGVRIDIRMRLDGDYPSKELTIG